MLFGERGLEYYRRVKLSRTVAILVVLLAGASPLLACLPNSAMTSAEVECCKKMAGNCDMGGGNHKCCDMTVNHSAPTATIAQSSLHHTFVPRVFSAADKDMAVLPPLVERICLPSIRTSWSPPGSPTVLRI